MRPPLTAMLAATTLLLACNGGSSAPPQEPERSGPDILLVTIDTLRADRVGAYGDPLAETPNMDRLASEGALFREAITVSPLTLPAHASILTGLYPANHGLRDNGGFTLDPSVTTLAAALSERGWRTGAFVSAFVLDSSWGLDRGFQLYHSPFHPADVAAGQTPWSVEVKGANTVNAALSFLDNGEDGPVFCWVHLFEPHTPWETHPGWDGDPYRGEVAAADKLLGRLLAGVDMDETMVLVLSDHGENLWDHGEREHGLLLNRSVTRVPLLIRPPGGLVEPASPAEARLLEERSTRRPPGVDQDLVLDPVPDAPVAARVVETPVSLVDLAATIADFAGFSIETDGVSLKPAVGGASFQRPPVFAETWFPRFHHGWSELFVVQDGRARLRVGPVAASIDLSEDQAELRPVPVDTHPLLDLALTKAGPGVPSPGPMSDDTLKRLAALGYVEPVDHISADRADLPDPRDMVDTATALWRLQALPAAEALPGIRQMLAANPNDVDAWLTLGVTLRELDMVEEALDATRQALELQPFYSQALLNAAAFCLHIGLLDEGVEHARRMQALNSEDARGYRAEVAIQVARDDAGAVARVARAGLEGTPGDPLLSYYLGLALIQIGEHDDAVQALHTAREDGSRASDIGLFLGQAHEKAGRWEQAVSEYEAYWRIQPDDLRGPAAAAWLLYRQGECARAMPHIKNLIRRGVRNDPRLNEALEGCQGP